MLWRLGYLVSSYFLIQACAAAQDLTDASARLSTSEERFRYYLHRTYAWQKMGWLAADTALDHLLNEPEWGRGLGGYGCQYASSFGRRLISNSVEFGAILISGQDTRFRPSRQKGLLPRIRYAVSHAFLATSASGNIEPAYTRFAGITGGALIAPVWHQRSLSASRFGRDLAFSTLDQVQNSLLTEFSPDMLRIGRGIRKKLLRQ